MSEPTTEQEAVERAFQSVLTSRREQLFTKFDKDDLAYLALVPAWTGQLAGDCRFPVGNKLLDQFLTEAQAVGLCLKRESTSSERAVWYSAYVYTSLVPCLTTQGLRNALTYILEIDDTLLRARSLAKVLPFLSSDLFPYALNMMQHTLQQLTNARDLVEIQSTLIRYLSGDLRLSVAQQALETVPQIAYEAERVRALVGLAPYLSQPSLNAALKIAYAVADPCARAEACLALAPHLIKMQSEEVLWITQNTIDDITNEQARTRLLSLLAEAYARSGEIDYALQTTLEVKDKETVVEAVTRIMHAIIQFVDRHPTRALVDAIMEYLPGSMDDIQNMSVLSDLAQTLAQLGVSTRVHNLADQLYETVIGPAASPQNTQSVSKLSALVQLLAQVNEPDKASLVINKAYNAAHSISDTREKYKAFVVLSRTLQSLSTPSEGPAQTWQQVVQEALKTVHSISDPRDRLEGLVTLVPYLSAAEQLQITEEALKLAAGMREELSFWMPDATRTEVLDELRSEQSASFLVSITQEIGKRILLAQERGTPTSPVVACWAEMAAGGPKDAAALLNSQVERLVAAGDMGQAMIWVNTATMLSQVFKGDLDMATLLGNRRLELAYRQMQDKRYLQYLLVRQEQVDDFLALLKESGPAWALHYIGISGVGKTTLIRHITANLAAQLHISTSRVDFDYLSPDYPVRKPGQLLVELAKELQFYGTSTHHEQLFNKFQERIVSLHEEVSDKPVLDPLDNINWRTFERAIGAFCDFLRMLPEPVIFILDTCEELAKLQPVGGRLPSVEATFAVLERIHQRVPSIRVLFAGRRLLARSGDGWSLDKTRMLEGQALLPEAKPYLRLHEIQGFTKEEAHSFLTSIKKLSPSEELEEAILKRSPDVGSVAPIQWHRPRKQAEGTRYNPFDLALYADWVQEDPSLTPASISAGSTDPFVEMRIVSRIKRSDARSLLPAVILLRRFDRAMLRTMFEGNTPIFDEVYWELSNQEWLEYQPEEKTAFLEINRNLYPRLLEYYKDPERQSQLEVARKRLAPGLTTLVDTHPLGELRLSHIEAALRILPEDQGAQLWDRLSCRITTEQAWDWARTIIEGILGENGAVASLKHKARAHVRATYIAAQIHQQPNLDLTAPWTEVAQTASLDPTPQLSQWLQQRALAGRIGATRLTKSRPSADLLTDFWSLVTTFSASLATLRDADTFRTEQLAASLCAAIEALLEQAEPARDTSLVPDPVQVDTWAKRISNYLSSPVLQAFAAMLAGRAMALHGRWQEAKVFLQHADTLLPDDAQSQQQCWADWRIPSSLPDYIRLQRLHAIPCNRLTLSQVELLSWQQAAISRLNLIDAERLTSAILTLRLARGVIPTEELNELAKLDIYHSNRELACNAHRATPPLFATRALALLALGMVNEAMNALNERLNISILTASDTEGLVQAAQQAKIQILRRMRMARSEPSLIEQLTKSGEPDDLDLVLPLLAVISGSNHVLDVEHMELPEFLPVSHAWWRSQSTLTKDIVTPTVRRLLVAASNIDNANTQSDFALISLAMDRYEAELLSPDVQRSGERLAFNPETWFARYPMQTEQGLRLMLRAYALDILAPGIRDKEAFLQQWTAQVGTRWMAKLALDEGELLALRLPTQACLLLDLARDWFTRADDPVGAFIAATCRCIATIHSDTKRDLDTALQQIQITYMRLVERHPELQFPAWTVLSALPLSSHSNNEGTVTISGMLHTYQDNTWLGWLERLVFCILQVNNQDRFAEWRTGWLKEQYGERLPIELDPLSVDSARISTAAAAAPSYTSRILNTTYAIIGFIVIVIGIAIIGGLLYGSYLLFNGLFQLASNEITPCRDCISTGVSWKIPLYIVLLGVLFLCIWGLYRSIRWLIRFIRTELASRTRISLDISSTTAQPRPEARTHVSLQLQQRHMALQFSWPFVALRPEETIEAFGETPGLQSYRTAAAMQPVRIVQQFTNLQKRLYKRQLPVPLRGSPGLEGVAWEALISLAPGVASERAWQEPFQFWRAGTPLPASRTLQPDAGEATVGVLSHSRWYALAEDGWEPLRARLTTCDDPDKLESLKQLSILHIIGTPVSTKSGWFLRIGDTYQTSTSIVQTVRGEDTKQLVRAENLPLSSTALVVIQAEPVETLGRSDTDRELAYDLRSLVADIFSAGARAVIMLPALPSALAPLTLNQLATGLRDQAVPELPHILNAVSGVRRTIATWVSLPTTGEHPEGNVALRRTSDSLGPNTLWELAFDVCLFARQQSDRLS